MGKLPPKVIDCHSHIMSQKRMLSGLRWLVGVAPGSDADFDMDEKAAVNMMYKANVELYFNFFYPIFEGTSEEINQWNYAFKKRDKRAIPFYSLLPTDANKIEALERYLFRFDFLGVKMHPFIQKFDVGDKRLWEVYEFLESYNKPIIIHTGFDNIYNCETQLQEIIGLLKNFPKLTIVLPHIFYPNLELGFAIAKDYPQVYLDLTNVIYCFLQDGLTYDIWSRIEEFQIRTMFGTDYPVGMGFPHKLYQQLEQTPLSTETIKQICYQTPWEFYCEFRGKP